MSKHIEINIPTSLSEITLRQFNEFKRRADAKGDNLTDIDLQSIILEVFCGLKQTETLKVKAVDAKAVADIVLDMLNEEPKRITSFTMNGVDYGIIPDLDDMTFGEYVDLDKFIIDYETMHLAMAVMYRPIIARRDNLYNVEEYTPEKYDMMGMPMSAVLYAQVFFYNLGIDLLEVTTHSLGNPEADLLRKMGLTKNGDGSVQFMHSLTGMLQDLKISLN